MGENLISICYEGDSGVSDIRTCYIDNILHFSLKDVFITLNRENRELGAKNPARHIPNLIKKQISILDEDERELVKNPIPSDGYEFEVFVTQPGLNRVMGSDDSLAGRKFQRWLYHEVVPSLTKHGIYPPPMTPQGSALSQMAEIIAQNSRALADSIVRQDLLEREVSLVKGEVLGVRERISKLEDAHDSSDYILSVRQWFNKFELVLTKEKELEIVTWCENLSLRRNKPRKACPSGERINASFYQEIIEEAKNLVEGARG